MQLPIGGAYTKIMREKLITEGVKMTHIGFVIINSHVTVIYLRFIKNTYFYAVKRKIENTCTGFFKARRMLQQNGTCRQKIFHFKSIKT